MPLLKLLLCFGLCASATAEELQWHQVPPQETTPSVVLSSRGTPENPAPTAVSIPAVPAPAWPLPALAQHYDALITDVAQQYAVDPLLVHAVIHTESAYRPAAMSSKGALGLMQVMPATGARFGKTALSQPRDNVEAGVAYLSWLMRRFGGRLDLVLAGYNAGEGAVARHGNTVPPYAETQAYVRKVLAHYAGLSGRVPVVAQAPEPVTARTAARYRAVVGTGNLEQLLRLIIEGPARAVPTRLESKRIQH